MYNQQPQKIEVIVRKEGGNGEKNNRETEVDNVSNNNGNSNTQSRRNKRIAIVNMTHSFAVAKQFANAGISYWVGGLGMRSGDEAYQDRVGRQVEIMQDSLGLASSIAMGATYGSAGGVVGALLGAGLSATSWGISNFFKYTSREREFNFKVFKENNAIEYKRARANINLTPGRLR